MFTKRELKIIRAAMSYFYNDYDSTDIRGLISPPEADKFLQDLCVKVDCLAEHHQDVLAKSQKKAIADHITKQVLSNDGVFDCNSIAAWIDEAIENSQDSTI